MGCGKTTLGRAVAHATSMRFIDLDEYIELNERMTVREIFDRHGEAYFRNLERETLREVASMQDVIIATGGGTPCQPGLMDIMNSHGLTVYLQTSPDVLYRRLLQARDTRPLIASLDDDSLKKFIYTALAARMPHYSRATATFDSGRLEDAQQISDSAMLFIDRFLSEVNK